MSLFRSDPMGYYNLVMPRENAWEILNELGELDALQFVDLNAHEIAFNRPYSNYIKRCEELEAKIQGIEKEITRFGRRVERCDDMKIFMRGLKDFLATRNKAEHTYFEEVEAELDQRLGGLNEQIRTYENLKDKFNHLIEFKQVLLKTRNYIGEDFRSMNPEGFAGVGEEAKIDYVASRDIKFNYLAGVINKEDSLRFKRILFRVTRGMTWTTLVDIEKAESSAEEEDLSHLLDANATNQLKTVFLIVYQGGVNNMMIGKLNKICDSFGASKYGIPEDYPSYQKKTQDVESQLRDAQNILRVTKNHIENILDFFCSPRNPGGPYDLIDELRLFVLKEKTIFHNLNMLRIQGSIYHGNCWCPIDSQDKVQNTIQELKRQKASIAGCEFSLADSPLNAKPPTYFRLNDVSAPFQEIVNTYGVPRYREINPGLFTIATFPFLFGVMFGDIGHGALILAFGIYLVWWKDEIEKSKSMLTVILPARYLFLLQGFFAFYAGLIYNDFMAMPFNLFGSCYPHHEEGHHGAVMKEERDCNYPIGIDPAWYGTTNELTFLNSFKMKLAIVLGVTHMTFGILLKGLNTIHFGLWVDFIFEFIPQLIFMSLTFGYMVVLIFFKWAIPWQFDGNDTKDAPSIIGIFIKMALSPGTYVEGAVSLFGDKEGDYQASLQKEFLVVALICVPIILFPKPIINYIKSGGGHSAPSSHDDPSMRQRLLDESHDEEKKEGVVQSKPKAESHDDDHGFSELFVHQVIETIEFVLGTISNTASYLRLWALSLAHSQLAKVFYDNTIGSAIISGSLFGAIFGFYIFAQVTLGVLLLMDQMECFLHALRLHWVEFQSKFYKADGYAFEPFSFEKSLKAAAASASA